MPTKGNDSNWIVALLARVTNEHGNFKIVFSCLAAIATALLGEETFGVVGALILAGVAAVGTGGLIGLLIEGWRWLKGRKPQERFRRLQPAMEAFFRASLTRKGEDPLEADRLADELRLLGVEWHWFPFGRHQQISRRELKQLIRLARQHELECARRKYGPTARAEHAAVPFEDLIPRPPPGDRDGPDAPPA